MTEFERLQDENLHLRAELLRAQEDRDQARERLAYALKQVAELGKRIPATVTQAAAPGAAARYSSDPLERLFLVIRQ